jgi:toxin ParE1/3/4
VRLAWTEAAIADLRALEAFIRDDNPGAARRQVQAVVAAAQNLIRFPEAGRPGRRPGTRELVAPRTAYIVAYRVRGDRVELLRVLHGRQRWPDMS